MKKKVTCHWAKWYSAMPSSRLPIQLWFHTISVTKFEQETSLVGRDQLGLWIVQAHNRSKFFNLLPRSDSWHMSGRRVQKMLTTIKLMLRQQTPQGKSIKKKQEWGETKEQPEGEVHRKQLCANIFFFNFSQKSLLSESIRYLHCKLYWLV